MKVSSLVALGAIVAALPAFGGITYTCNANIDALSGTTACETLQTTIAGLYASTFSNANASIFIQFGNNGGLGESQQFLGGVSYAGYVAQLTANEGDANDVTAVSTLPGTDPLGAGGSVVMETALANALGFADTFGIDATGAGCTIGAAGCYDGLITLNDPADLFALTGGQGYSYRNGGSTVNNYDFFTVAEHETDEVLGTISCLGTSGGVAVDNCGTGNGAASDLFRYSASGTRSFLSTASGTLAYFSINGGVTNIAPYNNTPNGADYGDWSTNCAHIQDAFACPGSANLDITNDGGAEIAVLDAVGYNLNAGLSTPEPATFGLLGASLLALGFAGARRRRRHNK